MKHINKFYPESRFGGFSDVDGTMAFYSRVQALLFPEAVVVDFGCGRGHAYEDALPVRRAMRTLRGNTGRVIGLDVDPAGETNPLVDEFRLLKDSHWPMEDNSADLVLCDWVLEHLETPEHFFSEAKRVLKNNGHLCIRTPNRWGYISILSRLIPGRLHGRVLNKVQEGRKASDIFPTFYRCNTIPTMRKLLAEYGFDHVVYGYEAEPSYLSFSRLAYGLGVIHQRIAPGFLRQALFGFGRLAK